MKTRTILLSRKDVDRFLSKIEVDSKTGCHNFVGGVDLLGYGRLRLNQSTYLVTRIAWVITNGSIPEGLLVLHKCDNPSCVNTDHLYLGTQQDNMRDKVLRGRNPRAKLTESQVLDILDLYYVQELSARAIARKYNIVYGNIRYIVRGKYWKHVFEKFMEEVIWQEER